jgi:hypothetical protein
VIYSKVRTPEDPVLRLDLKPCDVHLGRLPVVAAYYFALKMEHADELSLQQPQAS